MTTLSVVLRGACGSVELIVPILILYTCIRSLADIYICACLSLYIYILMYVPIS